MSFFFPEKSDQDEIKHVPSFTRICQDDTGDHAEYVIIVKCNTSRLSYLISQKQLYFKCVFVESEETLAYFVEVQDGYESPARLWSPLSTAKEISGIQSIKEKEVSRIYLFNEFGACVAYGGVHETHILASDLPELVHGKFSLKDRFVIQKKRQI